jgi:uncharacterized protein (DUF4415 family)
MSKTGKKPLTSKDGDVRELSGDDFRRMRPVMEAMPELIEAVEHWRRGVGRPKAHKPKALVTFRFDADLAERIRATGRGYGSRVERVVREAYEKGKLNPAG